MSQEVKCSNRAHENLLNFSCIINKNTCSLFILHKSIYAFDKFIDFFCKLSSFGILRSKTKCEFSTISLINFSIELLLNLSEKLHHPFSLTLIAIF